VQLDHPLFLCRTSDEAEMVGQSLDETKHLRSDGDATYFLSPEGWEATEPASGRAEPGTCFVAMAFDPKMDEAYDGGIELAAREDCKLRVIRVDRVQHNGSINDLILVELRRAEVVIADFTIPREGVYFEAGIALGLGRQVVFTCQSEAFKDHGVHFDTRPMNHVLWDDFAQLRSKLADRLRLTVPSLLAARSRVG
jgi:hypothetical protein